MARPFPPVGTPPQLGREAEKQAPGEFPLFCQLLSSLPRPSPACTGLGLGGGWAGQVLDPREALASRVSPRGQGGPAGPGVEQGALGGFQCGAEPGQPVHQEEGPVSAKAWKREEGVWCQSGHERKHEGTRNAHDAAWIVE